MIQRPIAPAVFSPMFRLGGFVLGMMISLARPALSAAQGHALRCDFVPWKRRTDVSTLVADRRQSVQAISRGGRGAVVWGVGRGAGTASHANLERANLGW